MDHMVKLALLDWPTHQYLVVVACKQTFLHSGQCTTILCIHMCCRWCITWPSLKVSLTGHSEAELCCRPAIMQQHMPRVSYALNPKP